MTDFYGTAGDDTFIAPPGNDNFYGGAGSDTVDFSGMDTGVGLNLGGGFWDGATNGADYGTLSSIENAIGSPFADYIWAGSGNNVVNGGAGDDTITGGGGADTLTGGAGADVFGYWQKGQSTVSAKGRDVITDFSHADGDRIDLSHMGALTFVTKFSGHVDQVLIHYSAKLGDYLLEADTNGDGKADFEVLVHTLDGPLVASDLIL